MNKIQRQLALEREGAEYGIKQYREALRKRDLTDLPPGQRLLHMAIEPFTEKLKEWLDTVKPGMHGRWKPFFRQFKPEVVGFLTAKRIINNLAHSNRLTYQAIAISIAGMLLDHLDYEQFKTAAPGYVYVIEKNNKWATEAHRRATILRAQQKFMGRTEMSSVERLLIGRCCIELFIESTGLVERVLLSRNNRKPTYYIVSTQLTETWLDQANQECELLQPLYYPMVVQPQDWVSTSGGGFLSNETLHNLTLIKTHNTKELMRLADYPMPEVYKAINTIQHTPWRINRKVYHILQDAWNIGGFAGLPHRDKAQVPPRTWEEGAKPSKEELSAWKHAATTAYETHAREQSKRISMNIKLHIAEKLINEPEIFFVWCMDWRGRIYPLQQFVHPQADDSGRALLEFAEGKELGEDGAFWLAVHGANCYGEDKISFKDRVDWVLCHEEEIIQTAENPGATRSFWEDCDKPFQFVAFCCEWAGYREEGEHYVSHLPVSLDGSCNGLQNLSAMLLDEIGGKATNLVPQETPSDIYSEVSEVLRRSVEEDAAAGNPAAIPWVNKIDRKVTKRGVMTTPYGVTRYGLRKQLEYEINKLDHNYLGVEETGPCFAYLSDKLYEAIGEVVVAARKAMDWLQEVAEIASQNERVIRWTTPVGFVPCQDYRRFKLIRIETVWGGNRMRIGLRQNIKRIDKRRMKHGIAPNFVHSLDAAHLMSTVNLAADFGIKNFSCIHDSYGTLAADVSQLALCLRETFVKQYNTDVLQRFRDEVARQLPDRLAQKIPPIPEKGDLDLNRVRESKYFFA
jgi:DNA-directed RNA polymerase